MAMVEVADTVVDPGAVVVHLHHAPAALPAVVSTRRLVALAELTKLKLIQNGV